MAPASIRTWSSRALHARCSRRHPPPTRRTPFIDANGRPVAGTSRARLDCSSAPERRSGRDGGDATGPRPCATATGPPTLRSAPTTIVQIRGKAYPSRWPLLLARDMAEQGDRRLALSEGAHAAGRGRLRVPPDGPGSRLARSLLGSCLPRALGRSGGDCGEVACLVLAMRFGFAGPRAGNRSSSSRARSTKETVTMPDDETEPPTLRTPPSIALPSRLREQLRRDLRKVRLARFRRAYRRALRRRAAR